MPGESFGAAAAGHLRVALTIPDGDFAMAFARLIDFAGEIARGADRQEMTHEG
jgi:arginine:pyruvate transaminase